MERRELEGAESDCRAAENGFAMWGGLEWAGKLLKAQSALKFARAKRRDTEMVATGLILSALTEHAHDLIYRPFLAQARQSRATFLAREAAGDAAPASGSEDGWIWPVRVMEAGLTTALIEGLEGRTTYFGVEVLPQIAKAVDGARFRRRHPNPGEGPGFHLPELTAGWMSDGRVEGQAVYARAHLLRSEGEIRAKLMAAREAGKLDLYGVSIMASFNYTPRKEADGTYAHVATNLVRFVGLDMVAEPGAGGRFLPPVGERKVS